MRQRSITVCTGFVVVSSIFVACGGGNSTGGGNADASASSDSSIGGETGLEDGSVPVDSTAAHDGNGPGDSSPSADANDANAPVEASMVADAATDAVADGGADVADAPMDGSDGAPPALDPACVAMALAAVPNGAFAIASTTGSVGGGYTYTLCPNGANAGASPPVCIEETLLGSAALTMTSSSSDIKFAGTMPLRVQDVPALVGLTVCTPTITLVTNGDSSCPGGNFEPVPVDIDVHVDVAEGSSLTVGQVIDTSAVETNVTNQTSMCGVPSCTGLCCLTNACNCALSSVADWTAVKNSLAGELVSTLNGGLTSQIVAALCANDSKGPCPAGTTANAAGTCLYPDMSCAPSPALFAIGCGDE